MLIGKLGPFSCRSSTIARIRDYTFWAAAKPISSCIFSVAVPRPFVLAPSLLSSAAGRRRLPIRRPFITTITTASAPHSSDMGRKFPSPTSTSTSTTTSPLKHPPPTPERPTIATTTTATITTKNKNGHGRSSSTINTPNATKGIKIPPLNPLPPKFRKLSLTDTGTVTLQDGSTIILQGVAPTAWRESSIDDDFLVLGVEQGQGDAAVSMADFPLGVLRCRRWLACARNKLWWMTPEWGVSGRELPPETQFLLMELEGGEYVIMLPLIDSDTFRGTLRPPRNTGPNGANANGSDIMYLRMESGDEAVLGRRWPHALLIAATDDDPYALIEAAVTQAAKYSGTAKPLRDKCLPPSIDTFAWCSWDAFYSSVSAQGLMDGIRSLSAGGAPPKTVIIDDGWQSTDLDSKFRGWRDPVSATLASAKEKFGNLSGSMDGPDHDAAAVGGGSGVGADALSSTLGAGGGSKERPRDLYIEGESEAISAVLRDVPAGTATGQLLQEVKAADDPSLESIDYYTMARQHDAVGCSPDDEMAMTAPTTARRRRGNVITRASLAVAQYVAGLVVGVFQAMIILFYQWVVDPAADGAWPVRFFSFLASGPLRDPMLQFYADQTNFTRRLVDIRANSKFHGPEASPEAIHSGKKENLASVIAHMRESLAIEYIYCWHGLSAYWSGVCPDAPAMKKYRPKIVYARPPPSLREIEPSMSWNPSVLGGLGAVYDPAPLFNDMHQYLSESGVTGVKVDCQAGVGMVGSVTGGGPFVAARYHAALEDSVAKHFPGNDAINCMCHSTENIYRWRDTAVARASDDFFPTDTASHLPHVAACAFNGLFISALALPDFDMFQSRHAVAGLHAAARAVSGGPVYVSDAPGHHNFEILHQLVLPDGGVLRAQLPGRPTRDCLFSDVLRDGQSLLKIWNINPMTGVVGVFNVQGSSWNRAFRRFAFHSSNVPRLTTTVRVHDVEVLRHQDVVAGAGNAKYAAKNGVVVEEEKVESSLASENGHWGGGGAALAGSSTTTTTTTASTLSGSNGYASDVSNGSGASDSDSNASSSTTMDLHTHGVGTTNGGGTEGKNEYHSNGRPVFRRHHRVPTTPSPSGDYVAFTNTTDTLTRLEPEGGVEVALSGGHAAIVTFARISSDFGVEFAPIGLKNMLNGGGAVQYVDVEPDYGHPGLTAALSDSGTETDRYADLVAGELATDFEDGSALPPVLPRFTVGVRGRGTLVALCSREPVGCWVDGYEVRFSWKLNESEGGGVGVGVGRLEIDVPQVGKHMEQKVVVQFRRENGQYQ